MRYVPKSIILTLGPFPTSSVVDEFPFRECAGSSPHHAVEQLLTQSPLSLSCSLSMRHYLVLLQGDATDGFLVVGVDGGATKTLAVAMYVSQGGSQRELIGSGAAGSSNRNSVSNPCSLALSIFPCPSNNNNSTAGGWRCGRGLFV